MNKTDLLYMKPILFSRILLAVVGFPYRFPPRPNVLLIQQFSIVYREFIQKLRQKQLAVISMTQT